MLFYVKKTSDFCVEITQKRDYFSIKVYIKSSLWNFTRLFFMGVFNLKISKCSKFKLNSWDLVAEILLKLNIIHNVQRSKIFVYFNLKNFLSFERLKTLIANFHTIKSSKLNLKISRFKLKIFSKRLRPLMNFMLVKVQNSI